MPGRRSPVHRSVHSGRPGQPGHRGGGTGAAGHARSGLQRARRRTRRGDRRRGDPSARCGTESGWARRPPPGPRRNARRSRITRSPTGRGPVAGRRRHCTGSAAMTRTRKPTGHVSFVGAGPGDPGLLTRRALDALGSADQVVYDPGIPDALLDAARALASGEAQFSPAEGASGDVAKVLLSAARSGLHAVHLVAGDPFGHETVVREVQAVARTAVPFELVPGIGQAAGVATYPGVPLTGVRTVADVDELSTVDFPALAAAVAQGSVALSVYAGELAGVRDGLLAAGVDPSTPVGITGDGTGETQYTSSSTVDSMVSAALGFAGRVVLTLGPAVSARDKLSWWENRPLYGWKVLVPRTKEQAGAMSERLRAYGAIPCEVPTIAVEPPRTPAQMERAIKGLVDGRYAWVVFTSVNAVRAV